MWSGWTWYRLYFVRSSIPQTTTWFRYYDKLSPTAVAFRRRKKGPNDASGEKESPDILDLSNVVTRPEVEVHRDVLLLGTRSSNTPIMIGDATASSAEFPNIPLCRSQVDSGLLRGVRGLLFSKAGRLLGPQVQLRRQILEFKLVSSLLTGWEQSRNWFEFQNLSPKLCLLPRCAACLRILQLTCQKV